MCFGRGMRSPLSPPYKQMNDFTIKNAPPKGQGLFSNTHFDKNQVLFKFEGKSLTLEEALKYKHCDRFLQIGENNYLDLGNHFSVFCNHECLPNTFVKVVVNAAFLISAREINKGDEITFDYSLTSTDTPDMWSMKCACSPFNCRNIISGFGSITPKKQEYLIKSGQVPKYVLKHYGV
jgi:SET domain-containing protein